MKKIAAILLFAFALTSFSLPSSAQMNNRPFSFRGTPDGGVGMSAGGKQAIINQKILGVTPDNMVRAPNGTLLDVTKGPGGAAIVSAEGGGGFIPSFRGSSFRGTNENMSVGVFNAYFSTQGQVSGGGGASSANQPSSAVINTWTGRVLSGAPVSYVYNSTVDSWTGMVYAP